MTLYEFNALNDLEKNVTLREHGVELSKRTDREYSVYLYQIDSFYVEVYHHNLVMRYRSFLTTEPLEPYLGSIDISGLFNNEN
jgi:hypothetical protein